MPSALDVLTTVNTTASLVITGETVVLPAIIGAIKAIKASTNDQGEMEYTVVINTGQQKLDEVEQMARESLEAINAELVRLGKPTIPIPPVDTPGE